MTVYEEIQAERAAQVARWGNDADDCNNQPNDYCAYIAHHSTRWFTGGFAPYSTADVNAFRKQMVKTAALAVAAIESLDRQRDEDGAAFYEDMAEA